jgi:hypothetical protein
MLNPAVLRCSSCGAYMYSFHPKGWRFWWLQQILFQIVCWIVVWRINPPFVIGMPLVFVVGLAFVTALRRGYHTYWRWRHPIRCQGGGHLKPMPQAT